MTVPYRQSPVQRSAGGGLADVVELILDKGLVIDAFVRVSVVGIELITIDARIVVASVDTYLRFAEATNRLDLREPGGKGEVKGGVAGALDSARGALGAVGDAIQLGDEDEDDWDREERRPRRRPRPRQERRER